MNVTLGPGFADEGKAFGMSYRLDSEIDIEVGPMKVMRGRHRDVQQLADGCFSKPREFGKRHEIFGFGNQQPESVSGYIRNLNVRSDRSRHGG